MRDIVFKNGIALEPTRRMLGGLLKCAWMFKPFHWLGFWIILFPGTRCAYAFVVMRADDGKWTENGKPIPTVRKTSRFIGITLRAWHVKIRKLRGINE